MEGAVALEAIQGLIPNGVGRARDSQIHNPLLQDRVTPDQCGGCVTYISTLSINALINHNLEEACNP